MKHYAVVILLTVAMQGVLFAQAPQRQIQPPTFIAIPRVPPGSPEGLDSYTYFKQNAHVQQTAVAIQTVLGERGVKYRGFEQAMQDLKKDEMTVKGLSADLDAIAARQAGADIKMVFTTNVESKGPAKKVRVSIEVEQVAASEGLGSVQGVSEEIVTNDISGLCISAVNNCIDRVLAAVKAKWDLIPTEGRPVRIYISSQETDLTGDVNDQYFTDSMDDLLKKITISYNNKGATEKQMTYEANIDLIKYESVNDFAKEIRKLLTDMVKPVKPKVKMEGNAFIRIELP